MARGSSPGCDESLVASAHGRQRVFLPSPIPGWEMFAADAASVSPGPSDHLFLDPDPSEGMLRD